MVEVPSKSLNEKWIVAGTILVILAVSTLPYVYGYVSAPPDKQFMGFTYYVPDHAQYLAWFRGFQESVLIDNRLTPETNERIFFNFITDVAHCKVFISFYLNLFIKLRNYLAQ